MNYYAELGVRRDASEREIRQAYRVLVRLLHPDVQTGDDLQLAAERQLSRLNEMFAVLMNADTRRAYDLSLDRDWGESNPGVPGGPVANRRNSPESMSAVAREASRVAQFALRYWALILIGAVIVGAAALSALLQGEAVPAPQAADVQPQSHPPVARQKVARTPQAQPPKPNPNMQAHPAPAFPPDSRRSSAPDSNISFPETARPAAGISAPSGSLDAGSSAEPVTRASETVTQEPTPARLPPAPVSLFSGNWFYTTDLASPQESEGYRATYVELLLSEKDGALSGNYRARYVVPDKAISPQVVFHLQGRVNTERKARVEWASASGARGEAELSVIAPGIMEFRWWSTELGEQPGLSSGTAKLVRQRTP
jgi:curved DNA-binding protein CbpA